MDIHNFLNPEDEVVEDAEEEVEEMILARFAPEVEAELDEEVEAVPKMSVEQALKGLADLRIYEEQQEGGKPECISFLNRQERLMKERKANKQQQQDIRVFFEESGV